MFAGRKGGSKMCCVCFALSVPAMWAAYAQQSPELVPAVKGCNPDEEMILNRFTWI